MIVRNEERFLEGCLHSLVGRVDEVVIVDTGSTDRSLEIARDSGARTLQFRWIDDFSAARNAAIDAALGHWILYIDADEKVVEFDRAGVERLLADTEKAAYTVLFRPQSGYTRYREYRLFRNRPDLRFTGVMHESILPALDALRAREGLGIGSSPIGLEHYGYEGDLRHKHERNLPLLHERLRNEPLHVYSRDHLGLTLRALGEPAAAEDAWRKALDIVRGQSTRTGVDSLPFLHLAEYLLDQKRDAAPLLEEACHMFPDNHALVWLRARQLVEAKCFADAMPLFASLTDVDTESLCNGALAYDISIFGANAHAALGLCAFRLGRFAESAAHYARAEAIDSWDLEFRTKRMLAEAMAQER
jgi:tetratricopeptide (TPR) repeat protein